VVSGNSAKVGFPVSAIATPDPADAAAIISYQWQSSADNGATWNPISGAASSSYVVQASDGNKLLRAQASFTVDNQLVTADSISFNGPVVPDLTVSAISAAGSIASGDMLSFSYIIKNTGAGDDTVSSWAGVFLDNDFTTTFQHNTWNLIGPILAGNTVRTNNSISTVGLALGDHTLTVVADYWNDATHMQGAPNDVAESDETNNATTIHFTVQQAAAPAALPDLVVDSITNPSVVNQGDAFSFSYVIKDIGTGDVHAASWAGIFLDGQATTLFGGTSLSGWNYISAMGAGGAVTASNSFSTAGLLGSHTLTIEADYWNDATGMANNGSNDVAESNEGNNSTTIHFTVNAPVAPVLPDLDVDSITPNSASVILGSNFSFSYVIKDIGAGAVTAASWAGIFLDGQATTLFGGTSTSGWNHVGPMAAGGAVTALNSFSTAGLSLGDHTLTVKADYWNDATGMANSGNNDVAESNEANNATTIHFTVNAATLLVQGAAANGPVTVAAGQTVDISAPYSGAVTFAADTGTLRLDDSSSFAGTVAGMTGNDAIDFADIDPIKVQPPSYDPSSGKLHVTDGRNSANIALLGNYMSSVFVASDDGHGGTSVVDPPALGGVAPLVTPPHA
jgi:subtilase family serine protease